MHLLKLAIGSIIRDTWGDTTKTMTSQMIYHRGGEPERAMHCWFNPLNTEVIYSWQFIKAEVIPILLVSTGLSKWQAC